MPATSRQAESGSRRSASGFAGSPSKSTSFHPSDVRRVWPRCRSPWTRWASSVALLTRANTASRDDLWSASAGTTPSAAASRCRIAAAVAAGS